ncbi:MAG: hypothetical protein H6Q55_3402 [Deltaproteobacteria bacterium]|nr:hypothetical protein [Deltaproteobacteria bacterium]
MYWRATITQMQVHLADWRTLKYEFSHEDATDFNPVSRTESYR